MTSDLILFPRNIISRFMQLYFPHDDMHKGEQFDEGTMPYFYKKTISY